MTYSRAPKDEMGVSLRVIFGCGVSAKTSYKALLRIILFETPMQRTWRASTICQTNSFCTSFLISKIILLYITFNGISTASLYHTYKNRESEETNALPDGLSLRSFLWLILKNSRLASLVKKGRSGIMADSARC